MPDKVIDKVEASAQAGNATLYITGVDPGFASDLVPLALASTCQRIEQIKCYELADYATYDGAEVMFDLMGFGKPVTDTPLLFLPGILGLAWGTAIRMMAKGLGIEVDEIVEHWEAEPAPESYDIAAGRIEKGTIAALKFSISGMVAGHPAIVVEHVTRTRDDLRPDWARPAAGGGSYRVEITGEPNYVVDVVPSSEHGDHNHAAIVAACGRIVNAIPDVRAAEPGIRTTLDLPLPTGRGTVCGADFVSGSSCRTVVTRLGGEDSPVHERRLGLLRPEGNVHQLHPQAEPRALPHRGAGRRERGDHAQARRHGAR